MMETRLTKQKFWWRVALMSWCIVALALLYPVIWEAPEPLEISVYDDSARPYLELERPTAAGPFVELIVRLSAHTKDDPFVIHPTGQSGDIVLRWEDRAYTIRLRERVIPWLTERPTRRGERK